METIDTGGSTTRTPHFLRSLARDTRGNTLAIVGAALLPLTAMIGSGVDMSRAYMAKTRLQSACDSAVLAGRRMLVNDTLTEAATDPVRVEAAKFLNFNFPNGIYGTETVALTVTKPSAGTIKVDAETEIPTSMMHIFGFDALPLDVDCEASQNFVNTDVLLVLDVTGSMDLPISDGNGGWTTRIQSLREAVMALYDELAPIQTQLAAANMRLRYGVVPYSSTVNVGNLLYDDAAGNIASQWTYHSRERGPVTAASSDACQNSSNFDNGVWAAGVCTAWVYKPMSYDTSSFRAGTAVTRPAQNAGGTTTDIWGGCIEEAATDNGITSSSGYVIPAAAIDLTIDHVPTSNANAWGPYWQDAVYDNREDDGDLENRGVRIGSRSGNDWACPSEAVRLTAWTRADMLTYVTNLRSDGYTYHDIGMIWGARMISDAGVFADSPNTHSGMPVTKHIIFMTDGALQPEDQAYAAWGFERSERRITGTGSMSTLSSRHDQRFKMICNAAKQKNVSIWVVAVATSATASLKECASSASQWSTANNKRVLLAKFGEIGKNIGALRLTQ